MRVRASYVESIGTYVRGLSAGDRFIAGVLALLTLITGFLTLRAFVDSFLVTVPSRGGTLVEGALGSPRFVNPLLALSDADRDLSSLVFAGLMGSNETGELVPVIAESYELSEDGRVYTFLIRENARFHDGSRVTADDVVFTVERAQDPALKSPELANWANVGAEAVDARTVRFTLQKPYAPFLEDATLGILPAKYWRGVTNEEFPFSPLMTEPVGAGPFKVKEVRRSKDGIIEKYEVGAFEHFARGAPYLTSIRFVYFAQEADLEEAFLRGRVESAQGINGVHSVEAPYSRVFGTFFNLGQNPLFARTEVRRALSLAIDRDALIHDALMGYATPIEGPVPPGSGVALTVSASTTEERLERARATLQNGGWAYDEEHGIWEQAKQGLSLSFTLRTSNVPELKAVAQELKEQWQSFGVPVELEFFEPGDLVASVIRPRRYDVLLFGMVVGRDHDLYAFWDSSQRNDPGLNVSMYANKTADELLTDIRAASDKEEVTTLLGKLNDVVAADYPAAFLYAPDFLYAIPKDLKGVVIPQVATPKDRFATAAFWYRDTERVWPVFAK